MCGSIVDHMMDAINYTALNDDDAIETFLAAVPEIALNPGVQEQLKLELGITPTMNLVSEVKEHRIGWMNGAKYTGMWELAQEYVVQSGAAARDADSLRTNEFACKLTYTGEEWTALNARLEPDKALSAV